MKLWIFLFTSRESAYCSARVAAPDRATASLTLGALIEEVLDDSVLCQYAGEVPEDGAMVMECQPRQGTP